MSDQEKMREEFEAFGKRQGWNLFRGVTDGAYHNSEVEAT